MHTILMTFDHPRTNGLYRKLAHQTSMYNLLQLSTFQTAKNIQTIYKQKADLIVTELNEFDFYNLKITKLYSSAIGNCPIICYVREVNRFQLQFAKEIGVKGFISDYCTLQDLAECTVVTLSGGSFICSHLQKQINLKGIAANTDLSNHGAELTFVEKKIMKLILLGNTSPEIAGELCVSIRTIDKHRANICKKFKLKGQGSLTAFAMKNKYHLLQECQSFTSMEK